VHAPGGWAMAADAISAPSEAIAAKPPLTSKKFSATQLAAAKTTTAAELDAYVADRTGFWVVDCPHCGEKKGRGVISLHVIRQHHRGSPGARRIQPLSSRPGRRGKGRPPGARISATRPRRGGRAAWAPGGGRRRPRKARTKASTGRPPNPQHIGTRTRQTRPARAPSAAHDVAGAANCCVDAARAVRALNTKIGPADPHLAQVQLHKCIAELYSATPP